MRNTTPKVEAQCAHGKGEPEPIGDLLRRMGFLPDAEDRLRRLELVVAELAKMLAAEIDHGVDLELRLLEAEESLGRLRDRISVTRGP